MQRGLDKGINAENLLPLGEAALVMVVAVAVMGMAIDLWYSGVGSEAGGAKLGASSGCRASGERGGNGFCGLAVIAFVGAHHILICGHRSGDLD